MVYVVVIGIFALLAVNLCNTQFSIPEVHLEAYSPKGFRAYIPDVPGIVLFAFNGKVNTAFTTSEPGEFSGEVRSSKNGVWEISKPDLKLVVGDKVYYWIFIQHNRLGYRRESLEWDVKELTDEKSIKCQNTPTVLSDASKSCAGATIFEDDFSGDIVDESKWIQEQYIPMYSEYNYEFVSYSEFDSTRYIQNSILYLKPIIVSSVTELRGVLDLKDGCTRDRDSTACYNVHRGPLINPPVVSGKITSNVAFKYGKIEIRAKLPAGDWLYPQVELIPKDRSSTYPKILVAYSRGNERLTSNTNEDIGGKVLFGGPVLNVSEPTRSSNLRTTEQKSPFSSEFRIYSMNWSEDKIDVLIDNTVYGSIPTNTMPAFNNEFRLTLGVGVGGVVDFPNDYKSGSFVKPWKNWDQKQYKNFYDQKAAWEGTWHGDNVALQVDYVKITAL